MDINKLLYSTRYDDVEVRVSEGIPELVKWERRSDADKKEYCYVLLYWKLNHDGDSWDIVLVGNRLFEAFPQKLPSTIWKLISNMQNLLDSSDEES